MNRINFFSTETQSCTEKYCGLKAKKSLAWGNALRNRRLRVKPAMTLVVVLAVFALLMPCLNAQNTGYMGKRVIFNMGTDFSPAWKRPVSGKQIKPKWLAFNYILSPNIEIIAHKSGTAGAVYHYLGTRYNTPPKGNEFIGITYLDSVYEEPSDIVEKLSAHGFGIFYKQYMKFANGRSPMGAYIKLQFDGFFYKCPISYENRATKMNDKLFAMKIEIGNDFLLFDRLLLSTGFSLGVPFSGYKGLGYDNYLFDNGIYYDQEIYDYARSRIWGAYWLGFTVNIGFLAF